MDHTNEMQLIFDSRSSNESFARVTVAAFMTSLNPTVEEVSDVKTAVSEAVTNAIIHGYERKGTGQIEMELKTMDKDKVYIKITDYGKGIRDIKKAREPMFSTEESREMSGMGFTVMESFVDKVFVESEPDKGTAVTLIKYLDT